MSTVENELHYAQVIVDLPGSPAFDYSFDVTLAASLQIGVRCVVPFGRTSRVGIVVAVSDPSIERRKIKPITRVLDEVAPLSDHWLQLTRFAADYYQHSWGEVALPALPRAMRSVPGPRYA
ncbi:MAG: primosomal protein N' family DNA-binding protein, partial [Burkholderiaceae bacterium]